YDPGWRIPGADYRGSRTPRQLNRRFYLMATILYVEDHPPAQLLMQAIISELTAHHLICAQTGEEARQIVASDSVDLYILDLDLPDTDGITLAQTLTTIHDAPVILVSAYA